MNKKQSAGLLLFRLRNHTPEFFLVHPGGPFWKNKEVGAWTIPKGEIVEGEDPFAAALREFFEETGVQVQGTFTPLTPIRQKGGKIVYAWSLEMDIDTAGLSSNFIDLEWPPHSARKIRFPEIDRYGWFNLKTAAIKINEAQKAFLTELNERTLNAKQ